MKIIESEKNNFHTMVDSLKKCRRANLSDINDDESIIEQLYVDPLDNEFVLKTCLQPNTTILIGRKGTGKSTIIARLQHEIRKSKDKLCLYLDVKTLFEQSKSYNYDQNDYRNVFSSDDLQNYLVYKSFLKNILTEIKQEVRTNTIKFFISNIIKKFGNSSTTYEEELDALFAEIEKNEFIDIQILRENKIVQEQNDGAEINSSNGRSYSLGAGIKDASAKLEGSSVQSSKSNINNKLVEDYSSILLKCFDPVTIWTNIRRLLTSIGIKYVIVCLDDFSEIEESSMKIFVDNIIAPLNNWSEEYFKFKIAAYPNRLYIGEMDPQKIEQIRLDYYDLYQAKRVTDIQAEAQKSVNKLLSKRVKYFCKEGLEYFFDTSKNSLDDYYKILFDITSSVPRNVGWILWYAYQSSISKDQQVTIKDLELAAEKYYNDSILPYFSKNKFIREPFDIKLEKYHLKEILDKVIKEAKQNKREISISSSKIFQENREKPLSSHFFIDQQLESIISSLELNFFITKYNEQKDQDSKGIMSFYSLNYGLCMKEDIFYGRGSDRKYVIQRRFNYTVLIREYIVGAKQIICSNCMSSHDYEKLPMIEMFDMLCPACKSGRCEIKHINTTNIPVTCEDVALDEFELDVLRSLKIESPQFATQISQELDCTYQKVSKRSIKLKEKELIIIKKETKNVEYGERSYYYLTDKAKNTYFCEDRSSLNS